MTTRIWGFYADIQIFPYLDRMAPYLFQAEDFALSPDGIHLLRNQYNFATIRYADIREARIRRSTEIRNAPLILTIGVLLVAFAFYQIRWVIQLFTDPQTFHIEIESIVLPVIPGLLGVYCLYAALRKAPVLQLKAGARTHKLRLRTIVKNNRTAQLEDYLHTHLGPRLQVDPLTPTHTYPDIP